MKFPQFPDIERNAYLFNGMVEDIADRERDSATNHPEAVDAQSLALGRFCLGLVEGHQLGQSTRSSQTEKEAILRAMNDMAMYSFDPVRAWASQQNLHYAVIQALRPYRPAQGPEARGKIAEYGALALLTRYAHPNMLAYLSLPHHELDNDTAGHYDIGVIIKNPDNTIDGHHLQVKSACFGKCDGGGGNELLDQYRTKYRPFVQLVSGCCDLQIGVKWRRNGIDTAQSLYREKQRLADDQEIKRLDTITDNLILAMTSEGLERGRCGGRSIQLTAEHFYSHLD